MLNLQVHTHTYNHPCIHKTCTHTQYTHARTHTQTHTRTHTQTTVQNTHIEYYYTNTNTVHTQNYTHAQISTPAYSYTQAYYSATIVVNWSTSSPYPWSTMGPLCLLPSLPPHMVVDQTSQMRSNPHLMALLRWLGPRDARNPACCQWCCIE